MLTHLMWCRMFNVYNIQSFQNIRHSVQIYLYGNLCLLKLKCTLKRYIHCHVGYRFNQLMIIKYRTYSYLTSYMHLFWLQRTIETFWKCHHAVFVCTCTMKQFPWSLKLWTESMTKWSLSSRSNDMLRITLHRSVTSDNMLMHMTSLHQVVSDMFDNLTLNENCPSALVSFLPFFGIKLP